MPLSTLTLTILSNVANLSGSILRRRKRSNSDREQKSIPTEGGNSKCAGLLLGPVPNVKKPTLLRPRSVERERESQISIVA